MAKAAVLRRVLWTTGLAVSAAIVVVSLGIGRDLMAFFKRLTFEGTRSA